MSGDVRHWQTFLPRKKGIFDGFADGEFGPATVEGTRLWQKKGKKGSVRELVPIANKHGIYRGGHFKGRPDGMHFEVARVG
jgi:hypothetical protein